LEPVAGGNRAMGYDSFDICSRIRMKLIIATGDYAHTRPLAAAKGGSDDLEIHWQPGRPETIFSQALSEEAPYDAAEMSLATTWALAAGEDSRFVAIPVFPSRMYRLSAFYVRNGIEHPEQLLGGRIGVVRYGQTAAVWGRALLVEQFAIDLSEIGWWVAERQSFEPQGVELKEAGSVAALQAMLGDGRIDCLLSTSVPEVFREGRTKRLFPDWPDEERALFQQSGLLPIMHTVLLRRSLVEARPELARKLIDCFDRARRIALEWLGDTDASVLPLPLHHGWVETETRGGEFDAFENGLDQNRAVLEKFASHMHAQGLTSRRIAPGEIVHPGS
jgi:4,5-dihydroxyphthalate decarboxylase